MNAENVKSQCPGCSGRGERRRTASCVDEPCGMCSGRGFIVETRAQQAQRGNVPHVEPTSRMSIGEALARCTGSRLVTVTESTRTSDGVVTVLDSQHATAFASDLELGPGQWPTGLIALGRSYELDSFERRDGDIVAAKYRDTRDSRATLTVFND